MTSINTRVNLSQPNYPNPNPETVRQCHDIRDCLKGLQCCSVGLACSHLDMEFSEVSSLGERIVLKLRLGCDTAQHKETKRQPVNTGRCEEHSADGKPPSLYLQRSVKGNKHLLLTW